MALAVAPLAATGLLFLMQAAEPELSDFSGFWYRVSAWRVAEITAMLIAAAVFVVHCRFVAQRQRHEVLFVAAGLIVVAPLALVIHFLGSPTTLDLYTTQDRLHTGALVIAIVWALTRGKHASVVHPLWIVAIPVLGLILANFFLVSHLGFGAPFLIAVIQSAAVGAFALIPRDHRPSIPTPSPVRIEPEPAPVREPPRPEPSRAAQRRAIKIFMSYRRDDSADVTGRIYDRLVQRFGREQVFKDVDSIPLGVDFRKHLHQTVGSCDILVAIIGDRWLTGAGARRIDDAKDFVRIELEAALQRDIPVIPLLVRGAEVPVEAELPATLAALSYRNGISVRPDPDFHRDMDRLIEGLEAHVASQT